MKKTLISLALLAALGVAHAGNGGEGNNTGCNGQGNANSPCSGNETPPVVVQGPKGDKGDKGDAGAAGADGKDGADGKPGATTQAAMPADVVTQGQLNSATQSLRDQIDRNDKRASAGVAAAIGAASIPQTVEPGSSGIGAGAGCYRSECGVALGVSHRTQGGDWHIKGAVTVDSRGGAGFGAGALFTWK